MREMWMWDILGTRVYRVTLIGAALRFRSHDAHLQFAAIDRYDVHWHSARVHDSSNMRTDIEVVCSFTPNLRIRSLKLMASHRL